MQVHEFTSTGCNAEPIEPYTIIRGDDGQPISKRDAFIQLNGENLCGNLKERHGDIATEAALEIVKGCYAVGVSCGLLPEHLCPAKIGLAGACQRAKELSADFDNEDVRTFVTLAARQGFFAGYNCGKRAINVPE